jgi:hypothetical protein
MQGTAEAMFGASPAGFSQVLGPQMSSGDGLFSRPSSS